MLRILLSLLLLASPVAALADGWLLVMPIPAERRTHDLRVPITEANYAKVASAVNRLESPADRAALLGREFLNTSRPVSEWEPVEAFDTARACERKRQERRSIASMGFESGLTTGADNDKLSRDWAEFLLERQAHWLARCVPASAVYGG